MLNKLSKPLAFLIVTLITLALAALIVILIGPVQTWFSNLSLTWATIISIATFVVTTIWAWLRSKDFIFQGAIDKKTWRDLRLWPVIFMIIMCLVYLIF